MMVLNNIYAKHSTDKGDKIDDYGSVHKYGDFYELFFEKYQGRHINMLEIGVLHGYSVLAHNEYFYENIDIYGIDIDTSTLRFNPNDHPNIHIIQGDSTDLAIFNKLTQNRFDIIIDDGSHLHGDMIRNLYMYSQLLSKDGIYIIEDIHTDYDKTFNPGDDGTHIIDMLIRHQYSNILTPYENKKLLDSIQYTYIYKYTNNPDVIQYNPILGSSITAIVKFRSENN